MESTPQQVEEDVLVGPCQPPPLNLEMPGCRNGLLEHLVVLGYVPIAEVVIWQQLQLSYYISCVGKQGKKYKCAVGNLPLYLLCWPR